MFILAVKGFEEDGAFSLENDDGEKILIMFEEEDDADRYAELISICLLYTSPSPRDGLLSRMPSSA